MLRCPRCQQASAPPAAYCGYCGAQLAASKSTLFSGSHPEAGAPGAGDGFAGPAPREPGGPAPRAPGGPARPTPVRAQHSAAAQTQIGHRAETTPNNVSPAETLLGHRAPGAINQRPAASLPSQAEASPRNANKPDAAQPGHALRHPHFPNFAQQANRAGPKESKAPVPQALVQKEASHLPHTPAARKEQRRQRRDLLQRRAVFPALATPAPVRAEGSRAFHRLLGLTLVALTVALVLVVIFGLQKQLIAEVVAENDRDTLEVVCERCADGTRLQLQQGSAVFRDGRAQVELVERLPVGTHQLAVQLIDQGLFGDQELELDVPVNYRLRFKDDQLAELRPNLSLEVRAIPGTEVTIDGQRVALSDGHARVEVDVDEQLVGEAAANMSFTKSVTYQIKSSSTRAHSGRLQYTFVAPALVVDAPGQEVVTEAESFPLAGRTMPGATLHLDGRQLNVDGKGAFAQLLNIDAVGETTVWLSATSPGLATRTVPIKVRRVANLRQAAERFRESASENFDRLREDPALGRGLAVAFAGRIDRVKTHGYMTKALLEVTSGCTGKCIARLVHGGRLNVTDGTRVVAYGRVTGQSLDPEHGELPEVRTLFVIPAGRE